MVDGDAAPIRPNYIPFPMAMKILADRLSATPEELAVWIYIELGNGGISAYLNANELDSPPEFRFDYHPGGDYLELLMGCWFRQDDIVGFDPVDRYITGAALIERWAYQPGIPHPEGFIRAKIAESRLLDIHPTLGGTQGTHGNDQNYPPLTAGLFVMSEIEQVEVEDGLDGALIPPIYDAKPGIISPESNSPDVISLPVGDVCAAFRRLLELHPSQVAIAFVGDASELGLSGNNMLEISARDVRKRVSLAEFGLVDRRGGSLNQAGAVLLGLAHGKRFHRSEDKNSAIMKRLRAKLRERLGIKSDPFTRHNPQSGWLPIFSIVDYRGRSDERAKHDAERRTVSLDQLKNQGRQFPADETRSAFADDEADIWLKENDPDHLS